MFRNTVGICLIGGFFLVTFLTGTSKAQGDNVFDVTTKREFVSDVIRSKIPVVAFYYSTSECPICKSRLIPSLDTVARNRDAILLAKIDLDEVDVQRQHKISTIPTTKVYSQGREVLTPVEGTSLGPIIRLINEANKIQ